MFGITMLSYIRSCCLTLAVLVAMGSTQNSTMTIPLNKTLTYGNKELYAEFVHLNRSSQLQVNFTDIGKNLSFIILQVHSHLHDVTLVKTLLNKNHAIGKNLEIPRSAEYIDTKRYSVMQKYVVNETTARGTNVGLHSFVKKLDTFHILNPNKYVDLKLFITVLGYANTDPLPGGCDMVADISPSMKAVLHNKTYITIKASQPKDLQDFDNCEPTMPAKFYMMYLPERNYDSDVYFDAISNMTTYEKILEHAYEMPQSAERFWTWLRMVSAYPGTGVVFVAVAFNHNDTVYAVYVPTHSYGCSPLVGYDCELLDDWLTIFLSVILFFLGIFMCYFGHWFFKTQIVTIGFLSGFVVTYIIVSLLFSIESAAIVKAAVVTGLCLGALRLVCWWLSGIPFYIIVLSSADIGFLLASTLYYMSPGGVYLQSNATFWSIFVLVILVTTICLLWMSHVASMVSSAVIGGYTAIYPLDYYMGSNLKYIVNNTVRRATVPEFNFAAIKPICQWRDIFLIVIWVLLAVSGFLYQFYYNKGRPPFPPPPRSIRAVPEVPVIPTIRRRSSVAIFWSMWVHRCRQRRITSFLRNINERTPLLDNVEE